MKLDYHKFNELNLLEKTTFLEEWIDSPPNLESISEKNIRYFFRDIIEREEDSYLKKISVDILSFLAAANLMKKSSITSILLDIDDASFVEVNALKYLYYFYDNNAEIKEKFDRCTSSDNGDICSEAYYRLGLIEFLNNISLNNKREYFMSIEKSSALFRYAYEIVENREDAHYFFEVTNFIKAILNNDGVGSEESFKNLYNISFNRKVFTYNPKFIIIEDKIQSILNNIYWIFNNSTSHFEWIDYKRKFGELAQYYFEVLNISLETENNQFKLIQNFKEAINSNILEQIFIRNFSYYTRKIETIQNKYKNDEILNDFLEVILNLIQKNEKKKEPAADIIGIIIKLKEVLGDVSADLLMRKLENLDDISNVHDVLDIAKEYIEIKHEETFDVITGDHTGQEIYLNIKKEIQGKIPDYSEKKLNVFLRILEETIRYLVLSIKSKRNDRFKYLYTLKNKGLGDTASEKDFQDSLYEHFMYSNIAHGAQEEVINFADGGRIDIVFEIKDNTFPIELKRTKGATTKEAIREKYLEQIHSYVYGYDQLGIFAVLDLTEKDAPVNDIRDLVYLDNITPLYDLENKYPDYIVVIVIPGNKQLPSEKSTYK